MRISKEFTRNDRTVHVDSGFYPVYKQNICNHTWNVSITWLNELD